MAEYCPRCSRGSWACGCFISFKEKIQGIQTKTTDSPAPKEVKEPIKYLEAPQTEEMLKGDERRAALLEYRDRAHEPYWGPKPREDMTKGW